MDARRLGRTGHRSSVAILGGAAFWDSDPDVTAAAFNEALAAGVNHLDVAPQYGRAQELLGPSIPAVRDRLFVACKTLRHSREGVRAQLEESLRLLNCDHFDLYQLHAVTDLEELDARAGAIEAIMAARDEGLCRWIGVTGHNLTAPAAHLEALRRYDLDTVMFPVNPQLWSDPAYRGDAEALLAHAAEHDVGVMAIKAAAARPWAGRARTSGTWYEPYTDGGDVARGVGFALSTPGVHAVCTPGDLEVLRTAIAAAEAYVPMDTAQREGAVASVAHEPSIFPMPAALSEVTVGDGQPAPGSKIVVRAPLQGTVAGMPVAVGEAVAVGAPVVILESMKMEHVVGAPAQGTVLSLAVAPGATVAAGEPLAVIEAALVPGPEAGVRAVTDLGEVRPDLAEVHDRQARALDSSRPDMVARRHAQGRRTARENIADLCDPGSFTEYGSLAIAAQRGRRSEQELIERTPADGLVAGIGRINGERFEGRRSSCAVLSYDYTVLAGTQGQQNHRKKDRLFELIERLRLPVVLFAEGGGGRPGDTDYAVVTGLDTTAFTRFGALSGLVPTVGVASGWCFAGNAALLGCCDVVIATTGTSIGMGGPAMIEGGGLGTYRPEEIGPLDVQTTNGVVDLVAEDDADAVRLAKQYLSYFQGADEQWSCADQRLLRACVPELRLRAYDIRALVSVLADTDSVLELRAGFGHGMVTALVRIEGRPVGVVANNPGHLGGAIDRDGADKAARFLQLCDAHDIPILFLCDTPGFMVGPEAEQTAQVRHFSRLFVVGASLTVPFFTIVVRKGYGLGAQAMAGGSFRTPIFVVAWPTGELGGMGLEGAVRLGFRRELDAVEDPAEREALFQRMVDRAYQHGKALNVASAFEIDDVIDPVDSRRRIIEALRSAPTPPERNGKKRNCIDAW